MAETTNSTQPVPGGAAHPLPAGSWAYSASTTRPYTPAIPASASADADAGAEAQAVDVTPTARRSVADRLRTPIAGAILGGVVILGTGFGAGYLVGKDASPASTVVGPGGQTQGAQTQTGPGQGGFGGLGGPGGTGTQSQQGQTRQGQTQPQAPTQQGGTTQDGTTTTTTT